MTRLQQEISGYLHSPVTAAEVQAAAYVKFAAWMAAHDTGPRSVTVGQIGRIRTSATRLSAGGWGTGGGGRGNEHGRQRPAHGHHQPGHHPDRHREAADLKAWLAQTSIHDHLKADPAQLRRNLVKADGTIQISDFGSSGGRSTCLPKGRTAPKITKPRPSPTQQLPQRRPARPVDDLVGRDELERGDDDGRRHPVGPWPVRVGLAQRREVIGANAYMITVAEVMNPTRLCQLGNGRKRSARPRRPQGSRSRHAARAELGEPLGHVTGVAERVGQPRRGPDVDQPGAGRRDERVDVEGHRQPAEAQRGVQGGVRAEVTLAAALGADGNWDDIKYTDDARSVWANSDHLNRLLVMAKAARVARNGGHPNEALEA